MDTFEYFGLVTENLVTFCFSLFLVILFYIIFLRRYFISILDLYSYYAFFSILSYAVPIFLFLIHKIEIKYFLSFISTQTAFFVGFCIFSPIKIKKYEDVKEVEYTDSQLSFSIRLFVLFSFINIVCQLLSYSLFGIPLFAEYRLAVYGEAGGISNLLKRILDVSAQCHIFLTIHFLFQTKKAKWLKYLTYFSILFILIFSILSGSKGGFAVFGTAYFVYALYSLRSGRKQFFLGLRKFIIKFSFVFVAAAILVVYVSEDSENPLLFLLYRIGQSGDVYYMAYPNKVIEQIPSTNWFIALFASPLSLLGLIPRTMVPESIGFFLMRFHNPLIEFKGPNPRMNIFSYVYFGPYLAIVYSFIIGLITSFSRNYLFKVLPKDIFGCIVYFLLLNVGLKLESDFHNALADLINMALIFYPLVFIARIRLKTKYAD